MKRVGREIIFVLHYYASANFKLVMGRRVFAAFSASIVVGLKSGKKCNLGKHCLHQSLKSKFFEIFSNGSELEEACGVNKKEQHRLSGPKLVYGSLKNLT